MLVLKISMQKNFFKIKTCFQTHGNSNLKVFKRCKNTYFLTTPIFYVNAEPHIGHLYTSVIADAIARFQRLKNPETDVRFMSGTDEHGLKISQSAKKKNLPEPAYCDQISKKFKDLFALYNIDCTDFLRTTEERHINAVTSLWRTIAANGHIYLGEYSGWYCVSDEAFVSENELAPGVNADGTRLTLESKRAVEYIKEQNYKFKLSHFKDDLLHWLNSGNVVKPYQFQKLLHDWINNDEIMKDLSISRPAERIKWGIPVPDDSSQVIYVWMDALTCYLTTNGYPHRSVQWPPDVQIIGKDILRFHGIFWPAFLMAANLEPPECILCHSHWIVEGEKMSKSKGNVVDPFEKNEVYSSEGFRYFLLRKGIPEYNTNYDEMDVIYTLNSELADSLGNLLNRCSAVNLNKEQIFPNFSLESYRKYNNEPMDELIKTLESLPGEVENHYENFEFSKAIVAIQKTLHLANKAFFEEKPWELKKDPSKVDHLNFVLHITMETLRVCGILLQPVIPNIANNLLNKIGISQDERNLKNVRPFSWEKSAETSHTSLLPEKIMLFRKIQERAKN